MTQPWEDYTQSEASKPWEDFSGASKADKISEGLVEDLLKPLGKAAVRVPATAIGGLGSSMVGGVAGLGAAATQPIRNVLYGTKIDPLTAANTEFERWAKKTQYIQTPEEEKSLNYIMKVMRPVEMAGEGWAGLTELATTGDSQKATDVIEGRSAGTTPVSKALAPVAATIGQVSTLFGGPKALSKAPIVKNIVRDIIYEKSGLKGTEGIVEAPKDQPSVKPISNPWLKDRLTEASLQETLRPKGAKLEGTYWDYLDQMEKAQRWSDRIRPPETELPSGHIERGIEILPPKPNELSSFDQMKLKALRNSDPALWSATDRLFMDRLRESPLEPLQGAAEKPELFVPEQYAGAKTPERIPEAYRPTGKIFKESIEQPAPFQEIWEAGTETTKKPGFTIKDKRTFKNILEDVNTAVGKKGAIGEWERSLESLAAKERLKEDLAKFSEAAKREGKDVVQYLKDIGASDDVIVPFARLESELKKVRQSESIEPEAVTDVAATKDAIGKAATDTSVVDRSSYVPRQDAGSATGDASKIDTTAEEKIDTSKYFKSAYNKFLRNEPRDNKVLDKEVITAGADLTTIKSRLLKDMLGYSPIRTVTGELLQNSLDATRENKGRIYVDASENKLAVRDDGVGMTPDVMQNNFVTLGSQGTKGTADMGGFGLAKLPILGWPDSVSVVSVADTPSGKFMSRVWTTRKEYMEDHKVNFDSFKVEDNQPTGTSVVLNKEGIRPSEANSIVSDLIKELRTSQEIVFKRSGDTPIIYKGTPLKEAKTKYDVENFTLLGGAEATVKFTEVEPYGWSSPYKIDVFVYNKGLLLPDISRYSNFDFRLSKKPDFRVEVDFTKTPSASDTENYPFLVNRTRLSDEALRNIHRIVNDRLLSIENNITKTNISSLQEVFKNAPKFHGTKIIIPIKEGELRNKIADIIHDNPEPFDKLGNLFNHFSGILSKVSDMKVHEFAITTNKAVHGFRPKSGLLDKDYIVINPFSYLEDMDLIYNKPPKKVLQEAATAITDTMIHEATHNNKPGHYEEFVHEFHRITKQIGHTKLAKIEKEAYEIFKLYGENITRATRDIRDIQESGTLADAFSDYTPEAQRVNEIGGRGGRSVYVERFKNTGAKKSFLEYAKERGFELEDLKNDNETLYKLRADYVRETEGLDAEARIIAAQKAVKLSQEAERLADEAFNPTDPEVVKYVKDHYRAVYDNPIYDNLQEFQKKDVRQHFRFLSQPKPIKSPRQKLEDKLDLLEEKIDKANNADSPNDVLIEKLEKQRDKIEQELERLGDETSTTLYSDPFGFQASAKVLGKIVEDAKEGWDKVLEKYPTIEKLDEKTRSRVEEIYRGVKEGILDPERVMHEDPYAMEVFKNLANAEEMKNAFMQKIMPVFFEATKGIKKSSDSSIRIGKVLDGQEGVEILTGKERKAYDFFKEHYDWMIHEYARNAAGSEANYKKILNLVNNKQAKRNKIKDLNSEDRATYDKLRQVASEIKGEKKISELDQTTRDAYERASQQARDLLHNDFKKDLSEGERAAYDILSKKLTDYLPHLFDKTELKEMFEADISRIKAKLEKATKKEVITKYKNQIEEIERAILNLEGGKWINFRDLPKDVFFRFFVERKGAKGYSFDAVKAFETYVYGIARKIYDEPALRKSYELYEKVDPSLKPYTKELVNHYMGYGEKSRFDNFARFVTTFEWIRTLGLNPRSAIVNLTQRLNTAVWVGEKYAIQAQKMMFLDKAKADALFDKSGVAREIPQVLMEGPVAPSLQGLRSVTGVLFDMVEKGNRQHAFLSGYLKAKAKGMSEDLAIKEGIKIVHKTQFRYGKLGMAKWSRKPGGKLALQFISYPVKQAQFLYDLYKKDKLAFLRYAAYTIGGNLTLQELFDTDMSNAIGFGINFGEMLKAVQFAAEGDTRGAFRHLGQSVTPGGGLLPSGPGPAVSSAISVGQAVRQGKGTEQLVKEITPVMYDRLKQAYKAVKNKEGEEYPIYDSKKHMTYNLSKRQLVQRTIGPRSEKERKESLKFREERNLEQERVEITKDIAEKFAEGVLNDDETAIDEAAELINKYGIDIGDKQLENEIAARLTTKEERRKPGKKETYQLLREGEMISDKYGEED